MSTELTEAASSDPPGVVSSVSPPRAPIQPATWLIGIALAGLTILVYLPAWRYQFVAFDDPLYVTGNRHVQAGLTWQGAGWAFTTGFGGNWHPLTWLSHMLDVQLFGSSPSGPHAVNVLLHAANAILVFVILRRWTQARWRSALVAALFALHPLRVESVAWVSERKDVLSAFFFLLTLLAWSAWKGQGPKGGDQRPETKDQRPRRFLVWCSLVSRPWSLVSGLLSWVFFTAALMSKPMVVTLPFVLLLLDVWPFQRWQPRDGPAALWRVVREKIPFFAVAAGASVVTFFVQQRAGAVRTLVSFSFADRMANVLISYVRYLGKTVWPSHLAAPYPLPEHWPVALTLAAAGVLIVLAGVVWRVRRSAPFAVVGSLWLGGMLFPTIGFVQLSQQAMADRYTYLPSIGLFIAVVWALAALVARVPSSRTLVAAIAVGALLACAARTRDQLPVWRDTESLSRHAIAHTERNFVAHNNLGNALLERGEVDAAIVEFKAALAIDSEYADAHVNFGNALLEKGRIDDAIFEFQAAVRAKPDLPDGYYNLGNALMRAGRVQDAIPPFEQAVQRQSDFFAAQNNLANALAQTRQWDAAIAHYRTALAIQPDFSMGHHNLGLALAEAGKMDEAVDEMRRVTELQPVSANVFNNLGWMLQRARRVDEAIVQFGKALELQPAFPEAHDNLARALLRLGRQRDALAHLRVAVKLQPDDVRNLADLAWVLATSSEASLRNGAEAFELAQKAQRLSTREDADVLRVRAAAEAESGRFGDAVNTASDALELADAASNSTLSQQLRLQLAAYKSATPFREPSQSEHGTAVQP